MTIPVPEPRAETATGVATSTALQWKLWIYTNYDCNLRCSYCVAKSGPNVSRRAIGLSNAKRLVDEAVALGFDHIFFTGGEPLLLNDIYDMLAYSAARVKTTLLTNAMLLKQNVSGTNMTRLDKLCAVAQDAGDNFVVQVSLDGGRPEDHDAYRGTGSWTKTVEGIQLLQARGFRVRLSSTETPTNTATLHLTCEFHRALGIPDEDHFVRPLARRGYAREGIELNMGNLVPEVTVNLDGVFWHPLSTDADMQVGRKIFPLLASVERIKQQLAEMARTGSVPLMTFT
jgi:MoaA/NifB/PqqE/SkfB family radical SAM enzyme